METIMTIHAKAEHLIYLLAGLAVVFPLVDTLRNRPLSNPARWSVRVYTIVATLQFLLGITQLIARWSDFGDGLRYRLEHAGLMFVAVACIHMAPRFMKRTDATGARNTAFLMIASIALIVLGTTLIKAALRG